MATEIEYKFLVGAESVPFYSVLEPFRTEHVLQAYLTTDPKLMVRVRLSDFSGDKNQQEAWITVKGPTVGMARQEFEYQIPMDEAMAMFQLCGNRVIEKSRYHIKHGDHVIELDIFDGKLAGLVMAEIEVKDENENVDFPEWFGKDVSTDLRYTNASLVNATDAEIAELI